MVGVIIIFVIVLFVYLILNSKDYNKEIQERIKNDEKLTIDFDKANKKTKDLVQSTILKSYNRNFPDLENFKMLSEFEILLAGHHHSFFYQSGRKLTVGQQLIVFHDEGNIYDNYAVKIKNLFNEDVGYVPRDYSEEFSNKLEEGCYYELMVSRCGYHPPYPDIFLKVKFLKSQN